MRNLGLPHSQVVNVVMTELLVRERFLMPQTLSSNLNTMNLQRELILQQVTRIKPAQLPSTVPANQNTMRNLGLPHSQVVNVVMTELLERERLLNSIEDDLRMIRFKTNMVFNQP